MCKALRRWVALSVATGAAMGGVARAGRAQQPVAAAGTYDPRLFDALKWRNIGPNRGGRSQTA